MATYACSDLHGMLYFYEKICEILEPDDVVYFLGDAGDRGPEPWETIKQVAANPQFIYLKGNHEDMLEKALKEYRDLGYHDSYYRLLVRNGGRETFEQCIMEDAIDKWIKFLKDLPTSITYTNKEGFKIMLSHAGFNPFIGKITENVYIPTEEDLLWDRNHYFMPKWIDCGEDIYIVHGHTPIEYLQYDIEGEISTEEESYYPPYRYCEGHKICIDSGAFYTNQFCLLDLDDFSYHHFKLPFKKSF